MFQVQPAPQGGILGPESQFWQKLPFLAVLGDFLLPHLGVTLGILRHAMLIIDPCTCV